MGAAPALAADYGAGTETYGFHSLPPCNAAAVVARIPEKFAYYDAHVIGSGLAITGIDRIRENRLVAGGPGFIDRRYCSATAWLSNGRKSEVVYLIEGPKMGFASIGWHVESCLPGLRSVPRIRRPLPLYPTLVAGLLGALLLAPPALAGGKAGDFDFYVLALTWTPGYCATDDNPDRKQCSASDARLFGPWPVAGVRGRLP